MKLCQKFDQKVKKFTDGDPQKKTFENIHRTFCCPMD